MEWVDGAEWGDWVEWVDWSELVDRNAMNSETSYELIGILRIHRNIASSWASYKHSGPKRPAKH